MQKIDQLKLLNEAFFGVFFYFAFCYFSSQKEARAREAPWLFHTKAAFISHTNLTTFYMSLANCLRLAGATDNKKLLFYLRVCKSSSIQKKIKSMRQIDNMRSCAVFLSR